MSSANVVDSSGWLEYLTRSARADLFAPAIEDTVNLLVPVISIYEVFKKVLRELGERQALEIAAVMQSGQVIDLVSRRPWKPHAIICPLPTASSTRLRYCTMRRS